MQVSDSTYDEEACSTVPHVSYEFPNGYRNDFGLERFKISESLFDPSKIRVPQAQTMLSAAHVVTTSVGKLVKYSEGPIMVKWYISCKKG